jgi:effector-binding domain-containing protein
MMTIKRLLLPVGVTLIALCPFLLSQEDKETKDIENAVKRTAKFERQFVVYQEFRGPVSQIDKNMRVFMDEFFKQGLTPSGGQNAPPMGIFPTSPTSASQSIPYQVGFAVTSKVDVKPPLRIRALVLSTATQYTHSGRFDRLFDVHSKLNKSIKNAKMKRATGPVVQLYLDNPEKVGADKARTEIVVPVSR